MNVLAYGMVSVDATAPMPMGVLAGQGGSADASPAGILADVVVLNVVYSPVEDFVANPRWCGARIQLNETDISPLEIGAGVVEIEESIDSAGRTAKFSVVGPLWGIPR